MQSIFIFCFQSALLDRYAHSYVKYLWFVFLGDKQLTAEEYVRNVGDYQSLALFMFSAMDFDDNMVLNSKDIDKVFNLMDTHGKLYCYRESVTGNLYIHVYYEY